METLSLPDLTIDQKELAFFFSEITPAFLLAVNKQRQIVYANSRMLSSMGAKSLDAVKGKRFGEAMSCEYSAIDKRGCGFSPHCPICTVFRAINEIDLGGTLIREMTVRSGKGQTILLRARIRCMLIEGEAVVAFMMHDISDEKRRETMERMFFHDFLNAASGILGLMNIIEANGADSEESRIMLHTAKACAEYLVDEIRFSRALAQAERDTLEIKPEPIVINDVMDAVAGFSLMMLTHTGVKLEIVRMPGDDSVVTDKTLIVRVLINLVKNAVEASERDDVVTLGACMDPMTGNVQFAVHNKTVMPFEIREQVFFRAFSTKGKGRGIGTYSVKLFTEQYLKGRVWFTSEAGEGTSFFVQVPTVIV